MSKLIIICGPSCVGKTPLKRALHLFHPELEGALTPIVLYNSREPRPGEVDGVDYHFRSRQEIESLREHSEHIVVHARSDLQAICIQDVIDILDKGGNAFFEGNVYVGKQLLSSPELKQVEKLTVFVSPLSREEILYLKQPERNVSLPKFIADVMRRKLLRQTQRMKGILSQGDLEEIEVRSRSAYRELLDAWRFQHVVPNHDGEDSENWNSFYYPIGDARKALLCLAALLEGKSHDLAEKWDQNLLTDSAADEA